jgi:WD40 repeat protein
MADVFISYSRKDKDFLHRLDESLKSRGREAWVDWEGIRPTEEFMRAIYSAIEGANTFVFVLTPDAVGSVVCGREIAHAAAHNKRMVPIVQRDVEANTVPEALAKLNWIFCRDSDDFKKATETLITALDMDLEWIRAHTRLLTRAIEWNSKGRNDSFLLRGDDLHDAERWLTQAGTDKEPRLPMGRSTATATTRRKRRPRLGHHVPPQRQPTALQTEYIIASRRHGKITAARELSTQAELTRNTRPNALQDSLVLGIQSLQEFPSLRADQVVRRVLSLVPEVVNQFSVSEPITGTESTSVDAALSFDGRLAAIGIDKQSVELWEVPNQLQLARLPVHEERLDKLILSPDGKFVATVDGLGGHTVHIWKADDGSPVPAAIQHHSTIKALAISVDGQYVVTGSEDGTAQISPFPSNLGAQPQTLRPDNPYLSGPVDAVAISPDGKHVVTSRRLELTIWETATGQRVAREGKPITHDGRPDTLAFSPDGRLLASSYTDQNIPTVQIWETATGSELFSLPQFAEVTRLVFSPHGKSLATVNGDNTARVWEVEWPHRMAAVFRHDNKITACAYSPDETFFATVGEDGTGRVWMMSDSREMLRITQVNGIRAIAYSQDGDSIITVNGDRTIVTWKSQTGPELVRLGCIDSLFFGYNRDGRFIVRDSKAVVLWDVSTGRSFRTIEDFPSSYYMHFAASDDLQLVATAEGEIAQVWDLNLGRVQVELKHEPSIDWEKVRKRYTGSDYRTRWREIERYGNVEPVAFSPDGRSLLTRRVGDDVRLWGHSYRSRKVALYL